MHVTEKSQRIVFLKTNLNISLQTKPTHNIESSKLFNFKKKKIIQLKFSYNKRCIVYLYESGISNPQTQADANVLACSNLKDEESIITKMQCLQFDFAHHDKEIIGYCFMKDNTLHFRLVLITVTKPIQFVTLLEMDCGKMENSTKFIDFNFNQDKFKNILVFINLNEFIQFVIYDDEHQDYEIGILQKSKISKILTLSQKLILLNESNYFILFNIDKLYITFNKEYEWKPVMEEIDFILIIHGCISPVEPINHENDHLLIAYEKNIDIYHIKDFNLKQSFVMNNFLTKDCLISVDKVYQNLLVVHRNRPILLFFKRNLIYSFIYESVRLVYFPCLYGFIDISLNESFDEDCNQTGDYINVCGLSDRNLESAMIHLTSNELEGTIDSVISIKNASIDNMTKKSKIVPKILNENGAKETIQTINQNVIQEQCLIAINSAISKLSTKIVKPEEFNDNLTKNICDQIRHSVLQCMEIYFKPMHHSIMESLSNMAKYVSDAGSTKNADLDRRIQNVINDNFIFKKEVLKRFDDVDEKINLLNQKFDIFMKRINDANDSKLLVEENFVENGQVVSEEIKIFEAVDSGDLPQAFELALMSNSLDLLTRLCNRVSVDDLFNENGTIILEQRIIISLIHQLTFNLNDDLPMKKSYLKNCLISIDCDDKVVKDCIQPVIEKCLTRISLNTKTKPDSELKVLHTMFMGISKFVQ